MRDHSLSVPHGSADTLVCAAPIVPVSRVIPAGKTPACRQAGMPAFPGSKTRASILFFLLPSPFSFLSFRKSSHELSGVINLRKGAFRWEPLGVEGGR
ncbi:MAG: hypothetical protein D6679_02050 [Candidatus Hydrogenedentota bacterium]|nr:MAG: hypothetical protein D6679_02050 [Candidatus Hydrogenedentota bacterium]